MDADFNRMLELAEAHLRRQFSQLSCKPSYLAGEPETLMLVMDDGIKNRTMVQKPVAKGPFPTILVRSCYPHQERMHMVQAEEYCKRGFAFVVQFCRGTGGSQGEWEPNVNERADGKVTIDWLGEQDWVENIGYLGSSYLALTGWVLADILPEKVKTLYLTHYGTDRFTSAYQNGLFRHDVLTAWAMDNAGFPVTADYMQSARYRPHIQVDEMLWGKRIEWYRRWITSTNRDDPYWQQGFWKQLQDIPSKVDVPVYIGGGWYDHHLGSGLRTWESLSPKSKAHSTLRIGAWNHGFGPCVQGIVTEHLENNDTTTSFEWFDTILRKKQLPQPKVSVYRIGVDDWITKREYPFEAYQTKSFYLSSDSTLAELPSEISGERSYVYDPDNPVISHGGESLLRSFERVGSLPQPECGWRDDVLSFQSEPLTLDIDILGKIAVELYVSSDAEDTAFTAKMMEVRRDGIAYNIRGSIATLAYREGGIRQEYVPGQIVKLTIDMWDISWRLKAGSCLRLDVSSSDFPQYAAHTNHAGIWALQTSSKLARQTLFCGGVYASQIKLPMDSQVTC